MAGVATHIGFTIIFRWSTKKFSLSPSQYPHILFLSLVLPSTHFVSFALFSSLFPLYYTPFYVLPSELSSSSLSPLHYSIARSSFFGFPLQLFAISFSFLQIFNKSLLGRTKHLQRKRRENSFKAQQASLQTLNNESKVDGVAHSEKECCNNSVQEVLHVLSFSQHLKTCTQFGIFKRKEEQYSPLILI